MKSLHITYQFREFMEDFEGVCEIEDVSISVKFVKLYDTVREFSLQFPVYQLDNMADELDFEG